MTNTIQNKAIPYYLSTPDTQDSSGGEEPLIFDVKPKRKYFENIQDKRRYIEEYTKKKKTELCKNFTLTGYCKFGDQVTNLQPYSSYQCSFAHGEWELIPKQHLHSNYKTKPCKRYFKQGFCQYGNRCQYIHSEIRDNKEFQKQFVEICKKYQLPAPYPFQRNERPDLKRFQLMSKKYFENDLQIYPLLNRLSTFQQFSESSFLTDSNNQSRKSSE